MAIQSSMAERLTDGEQTGDTQGTLGCFVLLGGQLVFFKQANVFAHGHLFRAKYLA